MGKYINFFRFFGGFFFFRYQSDINSTGKIGMENENNAIERIILVCAHVQ